MLCKSISIGTIEGGGGGGIGAVGSSKQKWDLCELQICTLPQFLEVGGHFMILGFDLIRILTFWTKIYFGQELIVLLQGRTLRGLPIGHGTPDTLCSGQ